MATSGAGTTETAVRAALKGQYHAALAMLREAIELCPDELWLDQAPRNAFWQVAYHALFFVHLYLMDTPEQFVPWEGHKGDVQHPDGIAGPADPESELPLVPDPYPKSDVLAYWEKCGGSGASRPGHRRELGRLRALTNPRRSLHGSSSKPS